MSPFVWQKSTFSANAANCVNVGIDPCGRVRLRESEQPEVVLSATRAVLRGLLTAIVAGQLAAPCTG
ncbi:DUF397 domain-containing protein [Streptomyces sp. AV19]|nr:DUF397 domain-containing protein [Streptomyces sp. AV19]MBH1934082.1 DUF397 domain-containing protein [Streptomyces sp. AV19]MDG4535437.1 DUF397 domain-containing protein [Streptomyces sp. AV19]